jgi:holdfast attachment protein HfaA
MTQGAAVAALALVVAAPADAQSRSQAANYQAGYGNARQATTQNATGSTRDANGNRIIVDGIIQNGASSYTRQSGGVSSSYSGVGGQGGYTGGSTAIGNNLNVVVQGNRNTVIVNSTQNNSGTVTAGTNVTGTPRAQ